MEQQAELYGEVAEAAAYAKSRVETLDEELKELDSELDAEIRDEAYRNEEKITENSIRSQIAGDARRVEAVKKIISAREHYMRLEAITSAFKQRSYMLRDMVDLHLSGYYSSKSTYGAREDQKEAEVDRITSKMSERRKSRINRHRKRLPGSGGNTQD